MMRNAVAVHFHCVLKSSFHTTQRKYQNLLKCAPYILGTTFRGVILGYLIEKYCTRTKIDQLKKITDKAQIDEFHRNCEQDCLVREFFKRDNGIQFSFGTFEKEKYLQTTRISLRRELGTASEGALANVECIGEGTEFTFEVILFEDLMDYTEEIKEAVEFSGKYSGIGSFKSVGLGRYSVKNVIIENLRDFLENVEFESPENPVEIQFDTPLVFRMENLDEGLIAQMISGYLQERYCEIMQKPREEQINLKDLSFRVKPEFIHRYSLETSQKENRLVMDTGSKLRFDVWELDSATLAQFGIGSRFGIGEWRNYGFGRFHQMRGENGGDF